MSGKSTRRESRHVQNNKKCGETKDKQNKKRNQNKSCQRYFGVMRRQDGMRWALYS